MKTIVRKTDHLSIQPGDYIYDNVCGLRQIVYRPNISGDSNSYFAIDVEDGVVGNHASSVEKLVNQYVGFRKVKPVGFEDGKVVFE